MTPATPMTPMTAMTATGGCYRLPLSDVAWLREHSGLDAFVVRAREEDETSEAEHGVCVAAFRDTRSGLFYPLCPRESILGVVLGLSKKMYPDNEDSRSRLLLDVLHPSMHDEKK